MYRCKEVEREASFRRNRYRLAPKFSEIDSGIGSSICFVIDSEIEISSGFEIGSGFGIGSGIGIRPGFEIGSKFGIGSGFGIGFGI